MNISKSMAEKIEAKINELGGVSFIEIMKLFGDEAKGHYCMEYLPNLIMWQGMSIELINAINILLDKKIIYWSACDPFVYLIDGSIPIYPVPKKILKNGYKKMYWLPVVFDMVKKESTKKE